MRLESDFSGRLWSRIYNSIWYPILPFVLLSAGDSQSRRHRLGRIPELANLENGRIRIWLHAASVGEIEGVRPVVNQLAEFRPDLQFVITTMTPAGREAAMKRLRAVCQLAPFDHAGSVRAFLAFVRPALLIITETEIWPNFFLESAAVGTKLALINARVSVRSMNRYRLVRPLIARALKNANLVLAQTADDAERLRCLGAADDRVVVGGNTKYEIVGDSLPLRPALAAFASGRPLLVAGSTGPGEEQIVISAYCELTRRFPSLALVLAPRHLDRIAEVERALHSARLPYRKAGELNHLPLSENPSDSPTGIPSSDPQVLLLDTMGELAGIYQRAAVAFVGGSLFPGRGGQSLAEPANASVPVLFGPYYENHRQLGDALIAAEAGSVVRDPEQFTKIAAEWLANETARAAAGQRARAVMQQLAGSTAMTVRYLCELLPIH
ncbi:MAG TPA: glycosyltransferase N-terminal domain-containing protein [Candidatus Binataceae bacterium]|nr:glycosyltransferase N-terminal domain-containing protein [Candidatus Binataceae bacterium]